MWTLLIETSTERGIVALLEDGRCKYMAGLPFGYQNSRFLVPKIDEGLACVHLKPEDLDLIAVGVGPGSYTGTRVGVVVAKSMAYAAKVPLVGISSLKGFIPDKDCSFAVIFDAKLAGATLLKGICSNGKIAYTCEPELVPFEKLKGRLQDINVLVTPNSERLRSKMDDDWEWEETAPDPIHMVELAKEKFEAGEYSTDGTLDIIYLER